MFSTYSQYLKLVLHRACSASAINRVQLIPLQSWLLYHCPFQLIYSNITSVELLQIYSSTTEKSGAALIKAKIKRWKQLGNALVRLLQSLQQVLCPSAVFLIPLTPFIPVLLSCSHPVLTQLYLAFVLSACKFVIAIPTFSGRRAKRQRLNTSNP